MVIQLSFYHSSFKVAVRDVETAKRYRWRNVLPVPKARKWISQQLKLSFASSYQLLIASRGFLPKSQDDALHESGKVIWNFDLPRRTFEKVFCLYSRCWFPICTISQISHNYHPPYRYNGRYNYHTQDIRSVETNSNTLLVSRLSNACDRKLIQAQVGAVTLTTSSLASGSPQCPI